MRSNVPLQFSSNKLPAAQLKSFSALRNWPPLTDELKPMASFSRPPQTDDFSPLATFPLPPHTDEARAVAWLLVPPQTDAYAWVTRFPAPATKPPKLLYECSSPTIKL